MYNKFLRFNGLLVVFLLRFDFFDSVLGIGNVIFLF